MSAFVAYITFLLVTASFTTSCSHKERPETSSLSQQTPSSTSEAKPTAGSQPRIEFSDGDRADDQDKPAQTKAMDSKRSKDELAGASTLPLPRMVDLGADKCVPCKMMAPILVDLRKEFEGKVKVDFIDVWEDPNPGRQYRIRVIPTQIFFDAQGKELFRHEGFYSREEILAKWREFEFIKG